MRSCERDLASPLRVTFEGRILVEWRMNWPILSSKNYSDAGFCFSSISHASILPIAISSWLGADVE